MAKDHNIIEFDDLFKENTQKSYDVNPDDKRRYGSALLIYALMMFAGAAILFLLLSGVESFFKTYDEPERVLESIFEDSSVITIMPLDVYENYQDNYQRYIKKVTYDEQYVLLYNRQNDAFEATFYVQIEESEETTLNFELIERIFVDGEVVYFEDTNQSVKVLLASTLTVPFENHQAELVSGQMRTFSPFGASVLNFLVYLILLPLLIYVLRVDIVVDFNAFKLIKNQWIFILLIGYVYLIAGNITANGLRWFLTSVFNIEVAESLNQIIIVRALNSNGAFFMLVSAIFMGPIVEELIFRKALFGFFQSDKVALVVSSLAFGAVHLVGETSFLQAAVNGISYFVMGFVFGYIYLKNNRNLWAPTFVHILSNTIAILGILFIL
jgi:uncharacterized protein